MNEDDLNHFYFLLTKVNRVSKQDETNFLFNIKQRVLSTSRLHMWLKGKFSTAIKSIGLRSNVEEELLDKSLLWLQVSDIDIDKVALVFLLFSERIKENIFADDLLNSFLEDFGICLIIGRIQFKLASILARNDIISTNEKQKK